MKVTVKVKDHLKLEMLSISRQKKTGLVRWVAVLMPNKLVQAARCLISPISGVEYALQTKKQTNQLMDRQAIR